MASKLRQYDRVKFIFFSQPLGRRLTLYGIQRLIMQRFKTLDSEAAISARIRDIRRDLKPMGLTIQTVPVKGARRYEYWLDESDGVAA